VIKYYPTLYTATWPEIQSQHSVAVLQLT